MRLEISCPSSPYLSLFHLWNCICAIKFKRRHRIRRPIIKRILNHGEEKSLCDVRIENLSKQGGGTRFEISFPLSCLCLCFVLVMPFYPTTSLRGFTDSRNLTGALEQCCFLKIWTFGGVRKTQHHSQKEEVCLPYFSLCPILFENCTFALYPTFIGDDTQGVLPRLLIQDIREKWYKYDTKWKHVSCLICSEQ